MKKILIFTVFALYTLGFNVANADTIPVPTCVNGHWQAPTNWQLATGN